MNTKEETKQPTIKKRKLNPWGEFRQFITESREVVNAICDVCESKELLTLVELSITIGMKVAQKIEVTKEMLKKDPITGEDYDQDICPHCNKELERHSLTYSGYENLSFCSPTCRDVYEEENKKTKSNVKRRS